MCCSIECSYAGILQLTVLKPFLNAKWRDNEQTASTWQKMSLLPRSTYTLKGSADRMGADGFTAADAAVLTSSRCGRRRCISRVRHWNGVIRLPANTDEHWMTILCSPRRWQSQSHHRLERLAGERICRVVNSFRRASPSSSATDIWLGWRKTNLAAKSSGRYTTLIRTSATPREMARYDLFTNDAWQICTMRLANLCLENILLFCMRRHRNLAFQRHSPIVGLRLEFSRILYWYSWSNASERLCKPRFKQVMCTMTSTLCCRDKAIYVYRAPWRNVKMTTPSDIDEMNRYPKFRQPRHII